MKKHLKLNDLKVQSFVTSLDDKQLETLRGGDATNNPACGSFGIACRTVAHDCHVGYTCGSANYCSACPPPPDTTIQ